MAQKQITQAQVTYLADLCKLDLSEQESLKLAELLTDTLHYINVLSELTLSNYSATSQVGGLVNVFKKPSTPATTLSAEQALAATACSESMMFVTTGVFDR